MVNNFYHGRKERFSSAKEVAKTALEKVTNMVGTFLNEFIFRSSESVFGSGIIYGYQQIVSEFVKVSVIQEVSEKVVTTVYTFCIYDTFMEKKKERQTKERRLKRNRKR